MRAWGGYPDGVAFAVLLMNLAAPTIDYYTCCWQSPCRPTPPGG
ncbi:RnfABCDGE type electron transport complex subunit D [Pseudomonas aeruginosa]